MTIDTKESVVIYAKRLIDGELEIPYYNLKRFFDLNEIEIEKIIFKESEAKSLTVLDCTSLDENSNSVILTISEKSWIEYLPSIYKDDLVLKNFLYGVQVSMFQQREIVDNIEDIFIPRKSEFLDWLASWYGVSFSSSVNKNTKRKLIYRLIELYKKRGTKEYLLEMVKILTGKNIEIRERKIPAYLEDEDILIDEEDFNIKIVFTVKILESFSDNSEEERLLVKKIRNILDREKPAFTKYYIDSAVEKVQNKKEIDAPIKEEVYSDYDEDDNELPSVDHFGHEKEEIEEPKTEEKRVETYTPKISEYDDDDSYD